MYKAYRAALDQTQGANAIDSSFYSADLELYWFFRAVDRAMQGKDLDRELADAQLLTEQFAACVKDSATTAPARSRSTRSTRGGVARSHNER